MTHQRRVTVALHCFVNRLEGAVAPSRFRRAFDTDSTPLCTVKRENRVGGREVAVLVTWAGTPWLPLCWRTVAADGWSGESSVTVGLPEASSIFEAEPEGE
ncbi:Hypothetical predicted protein [Xyrichtys novacula]|uniref:Uncharacterized protein n=1 Tax=Xyrichtys novacula TaxID=13765 RepID=A0AAV1HI13_XYRNO|nr:Hypothetical predicted protein [Xyrichtys novacula]